MKINKKILLIIILIVILTVGLLIGKNIIKHFKGNINKEDLQSVEKYLSEKYNMKLKIKDYNYYDNGELGINAGLHYTFKFKEIEGFELNAKLDYQKLEKNNLEGLRLNITNIDKAKELKEYVKKNCKLKFKIIECRKVEREDGNNCYYFSIEIDNNSNYEISGELQENQNIESASNIQVSTDLSKKYNVPNNENINFQILLNTL